MAPPQYDLEVIRSLLPAAEAARMLGIETTEKGGTEWASCPVHEEKTPSCKMDERGWHCFGCGEGGDSISLIAAVMKIKYGRAIRIAAQAVGLEAADTKTANRLRRELRQRQAKAAARKREVKRKTRIYNATCDRVLAVERQIGLGGRLLGEAGCVDLGGSEWAEMAKLHREWDRLEWQTWRLREEMRPTARSSARPSTAPSDTATMCIWASRPNATA